MAFDLEKLFVDVFAPVSGDVVTFLVDLPHGELPDDAEWGSRRKMAEDWHRQIEAFSGRYGLLVKPIVTYDATGAHNGDLPVHGTRAGERIRIGDVIRDSTILLAMTQYSASAPLLTYARKYRRLRVASMPMIKRSMEKTGLSADYAEVAAICSRLEPLFKRADGIEVRFSTGHSCHFDISDHKPLLVDNGQLHPGSRTDAPSFANLPAGEVMACPNEGQDSRTAGEIPAVIKAETVVFVIRSNQIVDLLGDGLVANAMRQEFRREKALRNVAEVAIGCNDKAVVTGNVLEDEKAGFHWAYGRSDQFGGRVGVKEFSSPDKVRHIDIVYASGNPIVCTRFDFIFPDGTRKTAIIDGVRCV